MVPVFEAFPKPCSLFLLMYSLEHLNTGPNKIGVCGCLMSPVLWSWEEEENKVSWRRRHFSSFSKNEKAFEISRVLPFLKHVNKPQLIYDKYHPRARLGPFANFRPAACPSRDQATGPVDLEQAIAEAIAHMYFTWNQSGWWVSSTPRRRGAVSAWEVRHGTQPLPTCPFLIFDGCVFCAITGGFAFLLEHQMALVLSPRSFFSWTQGPLWLCSVQCTVPTFSRFRESGCLLYTPVTISSVLHGRAPGVSGIRQGQKGKVWGGAQGLGHLCSSETAGRHSSKSARRSNQAILKEISPGCSLEGLMLKLKLQYFGHLMRRADSFEKTLVLGRIGAGGEGDNRGWDGWMVSPTWRTWVWVNSGSWWWTGRPGLLSFMGSQRVGHD